MMATPTTITLPTYTEKFIADAVTARIARELGVQEIGIRFDHKASGVEADSLPRGVDAPTLLREAQLAFELAEAAHLFRVHGEGYRILHVRVFTPAETGLTRLQAQAAAAMLQEVYDLWARASGFEEVELRVIAAPYSDRRGDARPEIAPAPQGEPSCTVQDLTEAATLALASLEDVVVREVVERSVAA